MGKVANRLVNTSLVVGGIEETHFTDTLEHASSDLQKCGKLISRWSLDICIEFTLLQVLLYFKIAERSNVLSIKSSEI
jgi:hypothetical protein